MHFVLVRTRLFWTEMQADDGRRRRKDMPVKIDWREKKQVARK